MNKSRTAVFIHCEQVVIMVLKNLKNIVDKKQHCCCAYSMGKYFHKGCDRKNVFFTAKHTVTQLGTLNWQHNNANRSIIFKRCTFKCSSNINRLGSQSEYLWFETIQHGKNFVFRCWMCSSKTKLLSTWMWRSSSITDCKQQRHTSPCPAAGCKQHAHIHTHSLSFISLLPSVFALHMLLKHSTITSPPYSV